MGIKADSVRLRETLLKQNLYTPKDVYDLRSDALTKTLDALQRAGIDARASMLISGVEALSDATPLVLEGAAQRMLAFGRNLADSYLHERLPEIRPDNLFKRGKLSDIFEGPELDTTITPRERASTVIDFIQRYRGGALPANPLDGPSDDYEYNPGGAKYYEYLGAGQKQHLHQQLAKNTFKLYSNGERNMLTLYQGRFSLERASYDPDWVAARESATKDGYSSYVLDRFGNTSQDRTPVLPRNLTDVAALIEDPQDLIDREGFGNTAVRGLYEPEYEDDENRFLRYTGASADTITGALLDDGMPSGLGSPKRGMLYFTQQWARTGTKAGKRILHDTIDYGMGDNNRVVWKGTSECRSFTIRDQYNSYDALQRFEGNGNPLSVIGESVMPRIYPTEANNTYNQKDNSRVFFSIENLAYTQLDLTRLGLPASEWGPNGGRTMWFPPYDLSFSESSTAKWSETEIIGRIEPVYAYNGASRVMQLSFMLLIDFPPELRDVPRSQLQNWAEGCGWTPAEPNFVPKPETPQNPPTVTPPTTINIKPLTLYFDNNIDTVDTNYEVINQQEDIDVDGDTMTSYTAYGLNIDFFDGIGAYTDDVTNTTKNGGKGKFTIRGTTSALATNDYNAKLAFRRADHLARYMASEFGSPIVSASQDAWIEANITAANMLTKYYDLISGDGSLTFRITGSGERDAGAGSDELSEKNTLEAKKARSAIMETGLLTFVPPQNVGAVNPSSTATPVTPVPPTVAETKIFQPSDLFIKTPTMGTKIPTFNNALEYYRPAFHSQTPWDYARRREFLQQLVRPGSTPDPAALVVGKNSLFGRQPVVVLRLGDQFHVKALVQNVEMDNSDPIWDLNPEGMGAQTMYVKVSMQLTILGGMTMEGPLPQLLTATDSYYYANSTYNDDRYYTTTDEKGYRPPAPVKNEPQQGT